MSHLSPLCLLTVAALGAVSLAQPAAAQGAHRDGGTPRAARPAAAAADRRASVQADLEMMQREEPFLHAREAFLDAAAAGDAALAESMISRKLRANAGDEAVKRVIRTQVLPFFDEHPEVRGAATVTGTTNQFGDKGFAYYLFATRPGGADPRPFALYMVEEDGRLVVANVLVDHRVPGRHPEP